MSREKENILEPRLCKAARGLLDWSQEELAAKIGSSKKTITDFERGNRKPQPRTLQDISYTFKEAGIEFENNDKISAVKLHKQKLLPPLTSSKKF